MIERYCTSEMRAVWAPQNKTQRWLDVELAVCDALAAAGRIPREAAQSIRQSARFDLDRIEELEKTTRHDVMAFVRNVAETVGAPGRYLHFGLTSYDVVDTALALLLRESIDLILSKAQTLLALIQRRAREEANTPMVGRTHGIHAEPITFGFKLSGWAAELVRDIECMQRARETISVGKVSGAVGIHATIDPSIEKAVCDSLGLSPDPVSTQIICRDRHAQFMSTLAIAAGSLERWATEIRNLARTEIGEVQESFAGGQTGSSAMPHKRNPWNCETVSGLARVVRGNLMAMLESMASWHERDLTNSSVERIILPDSCMMVDWMFSKFTMIVEGLVVNRERMRTNLSLLGDLVFSEHVMLLLIAKGLTRERAYDLVQRNAAKVWDDHADFRRSLESDADIRSMTTAEELANCLDLKRHLRHVANGVQ